MRVLILSLTLFFFKVTISQELFIGGKKANNEVALMKIEEVNEHINKTRKNLFNNLNKKNITTNFLIDKLFFSENKLVKYSNFINTSLSSKNWRDVYNLLYLSQLKPNNLDSLKIINRKIKDFYIEGSVPLGLIDINYNKIKKEAIKNGLIYYKNNRYYELPESNKVSYDIRNLYIVAPLVTTINSLSTSFILPEELFFSNTDNNVGLIEIDFDNGDGFQNIYINQPINVVFERSGIKEVKILLKKGELTALYRSKITIIGEDHTTKGSSTGGYQNPDFTKLLSDDSRAYIEYGCGNNDKLTKPFIFVEGLNFNPPDDCPESNLRYGTFGWDVFRSGIDISCSDDPLRISYMPDLIEKLKSEGFDIIMLDFKDGAAAIESNADILIELINWAKVKLTNNNSDNKFVVAGASMGGVVTRYALSKMEQLGQDHNSRLYLSFDAPHNGANIPIGDQYLLNFFAGITAITDEKPEIIIARDKINKMAPKQLMCYHFSSGITSVWHNNLIADVYYQFPANVFSVGIANGSGNSLGQGYLPSNKMIDIDEKVKKAGIRVARIQAESFAISDGSPFFWGKVWILGQGITEFPSTSCSGCKPLDTSPGATRNTNKEIGQGSEVYAHHSFIPTISALSLNTTNYSFDISSSSLMDNYPYIRSNNSLLCPFNMIYINSNYVNEDHVETTFENVSWITDKLSPHNLRLQNINIEGKYEARNTINAGKDIFVGINSPDIGDVIVEIGNNAELIAGDAIILQNGFKAKKGSVFHAKLDDLCSSYDISNQGNKSDKQVGDIDNFIFNTIINSELSIDKSNIIDLYPNPNNGIFTIKIKRNACVGFTINIVNSLGRTVYSTISECNIKTIDITGKPSGIYLINILFQNKIYRKKFVVR